MTREYMGLETGIRIAHRLLEYIGEDPQREGLLDTPSRFAKAWREFTVGYDVDIKALLTVFEDGATDYDEMVVVQDIPVHSQCEHHMIPFFGTATIAYIPNKHIVGLSKINRLVDAFARRLQVHIEARGIKQQGSLTVTSALRGVMHDEASARAEFLALRGRT